MTRRGCIPAGTHIVPGISADRVCYSPAAMIKVSFLMRRPPHMTRDDFQTYWLEKHPAAVPEEAIPALGIKRYIQVHTLESKARDVIVGPRQGLVEPFDGIAELWFDSEDAIVRDWTNDAVADHLRAFFEDEKNFIDWTRSTILVSKEIVLMP